MPLSFSPLFQSCLVLVHPPVICFLTHLKPPSPSKRNQQTGSLQSFTMGLIQYRSRLALKQRSNGYQITLVSNSTLTTPSKFSRKYRMSALKWLWPQDSNPGCGTNCCNQDEDWWGKQWVVCYGKPFRDKNLWCDHEAMFMHSANIKSYVIRRHSTTT